jgi:hypothetical protein
VYMILQGQPKTHMTSTQLLQHRHSIRMKPLYKLDEIGISIHSIHKTLQHYKLHAHTQLLYICYPTLASLQPPFHSDPTLLPDLTTYLTHRQTLAHKPLPDTVPRTPGASTWTSPGIRPSITTMNY